MFDDRDREPPTPELNLGELEAGGVRLGLGYTQLLGGIVERATVSIVITDPSQKIVWVNSGFTRITGYHLDEVLGKTPGEVLQSPETDLSTLIRLRDSLHAGRAVRCEIQNRRRDGSCFWMDMDVQPLIDSHGVSRGFVGFGTDVTEQVMMRQDLAQQASRLGLAVTAAELGTWEWNPQSDEAIFNDRWYTMLGYEPGALPASGRTWAMLLHPDDAPPIIASLEDHFAGRREHFGGEVRMRCADGAWRWVQTTGKVIERDPAGSPNKVAGIHLDIHEAHISKESLFVSQKRLASIFATLRDGVVFQDLTGAVVEYNPMARTILGMTEPGTDEEDFLALRWRLIRENGFPVSPDEYPALRVLRTGGPEHDVALGVQRSDGEKRWLSLSSEPIRGDDGKIVGAVTSFTDVTEERMSRQMMARAKRTAEEANRAKGEFLANISHEIRTPMNAIIGMTELCLDTELTEEQRDYLETVRSSGDSLVRLLNDVLDFSKIEAGRVGLLPVRTRLRDLLARLENLFRSRVEEKRLSFSVTVADDVPEWVIVDDIRLGQVFTNLIGNALKFTPPAGRVEISLDVVRERTPHLRLRATVSDTGIGVAPEKQEAIFEAFSQADGSTTRQFGGTGLGLSITKQLVALLGGEISIESALGVGSRFVFTFDVEMSESRSAEPVAASTIRPEQELANWAPRVLLVEDNHINQKLARRTLEKAGCRCAVASDGREAIELLQAAGFVSGYDLVLMDCQMPHLDGYDTTRQIRALEAGTERRIPIIAMTAHALAGDRERCLAAGMDDYLAKPLDRLQLFRTMLRYRGSSQGD